MGKDVLVHANHQGLLFCRNNVLNKGENLFDTDVVDGQP